MQGLIRLVKLYWSPLIVACMFITAAFVSTTAIRYDWQWWRVPDYLVKSFSPFRAGPLLLGLLVTLKISAVSMVFAVMLGLSAALLKISESFAGRILSGIYVESIRNTPLIVQIFVMYFAIAPIFNMSAFVSAVTALSLFEGAYMTEIIRAGIQSVRKGQREAAMSLGLTRYQSYRFIILPQALRRVLPPLTGQSVSLIKDSALVSTIAIFDLTMAGQSIVSDTFLTFEIWFTVAAMYLIITVTLSIFSGYLEKRFNVH